MLIDNTPDSSDERELEGCKLYTFPLKPDESKEVTLYSLKMGTYYPLISSKEYSCVNHDSFFNIITANATVFEKEIKDKKEKDDLINQDSCEVRKAFGDKE